MPGVLVEAGFISNEEEENGESHELYEFDMGGVSLGIDYKVLAGSGLLKIELIDFDEVFNEDVENGPLLPPFGESVEVEVLLGGRRSTDEGTLSAAMPDDMSAFDLAVITVEGDLEVTLTGISLVTNSTGGLE